MCCVCGKPLLFRAGKGRPQKYCSDLCRLHAFRSKIKATETKMRETKSEDIRFYCGLNEVDWNHHPLQPGSLVCIAPVYGKSSQTKKTNRVLVPEEVEQVLMDSAAFSDTTGGRLTFQEAMYRQVAHAYRFGYVEKVAHIASYDLLIDEKWQNGERSKQRWSAQEADYAVDETVYAAQYLASQRRFLRGAFGRSVGLVLSAQGVEVGQYVRCVERIVPLLEDDDIFGLGGFCITGLQPQRVLPSFRSIVQAVIPLLGAAHIKRVHIWGVIFPEALAWLLTVCERYAIQLSTDSSGPCRYPVLGQWGYGSWRLAGYKVPPILASCKAVDASGKKMPVCGSEVCCRGQERIRHVRLTREYLAHFRMSEAALMAAVSSSLLVGG